MVVQVASTAKGQQAVQPVGEVQIHVACVVVIHHPSEK
jgi:hypothetical protein